MSKGAGTSVVCSVAPMLSVRNGARAVEFYKSAFGAIEVFRIEDPGGAVVSRLSVDGAEYWVADESPEHGNFSPESLGGGSVWGVSPRGRLQLDGKRLRLSTPPLFVGGRTSTFDLVWEREE